MSGIKTVFITGPTASGKTALSVRLAKEFGGEIAVSYTHLDVYKRQISKCVDGEDPDTCDTSTGCTGSCSTCGGCH